jgi:hypothetical protein
MQLRDSKKCEVANPDTLSFQVEEERHDVNGQANDAGKYDQNNPAVIEYMLQGGKQ